MTAWGRSLPKGFVNDLAGAGHNRSPTSRAEFNRLRALWPSFVLYRIVFPAVHYVVAAEKDTAVPERHAYVRRE